MGAVAVGDKQFIEFEVLHDGGNSSEMWDFEVMSNGHISCMQCENRPIWCSHIGRLIVENGDAEQLWERVDDFPEFDIPIFPSSNMWAHIFLSFTKFEDARKLTFIPPDTALTMGDEGQFVGFLHRSEGRNIARSMILDWFQGWVREEDLLCRSSGHSFKQQMDWEAAMKDNFQKHRNLWSVWTTKACMSCQLGGDNWSDLIPENPETRKW